MEHADGDPQRAHRLRGGIGERRPVMRRQVSFHYVPDLDEIRLGAEALRRHRYDVDFPILDITLDAEFRTTYVRLGQQPFADDETEAFEPVGTRDGLVQRRTVVDPAHHSAAGRVQRLDHRGIADQPLDCIKFLAVCRARLERRTASDRHTGHAQHLFHEALVAQGLRVGDVDAEQPQPRRDRGDRRNAEFESRDDRHQVGGGGELLGGRDRRRDRGEVNLLIDGCAGGDGLASWRCQCGEWPDIENHHVVAECDRGRRKAMAGRLGFDDQYRLRQRGSREIRGNRTRPIATESHLRDPIATAKIALNTIHLSFPKTYAAGRPRVQVTLRTARFLIGTFPRSLWVIGVRTRLPLLRKSGNRNS